MKEQVLATKDEIIVRDLYPILVSNKRIYIVNGKKRKFRKIETKKIIQLDKISAVRYQFSKNKLLLALSLRRMPTTNFSLSFFICLLLLIHYTTNSTIQDCPYICNIQHVFLLFGMRDLHHRDT